MKSNVKKSEGPPALSDLQGWRQAATAERLGRFRPEDVVAAIQQIGPNGDQKLLNALVLHISDVMMRILRGHVGTNHRNEGWDIVEGAHEKLILAVLNPNCADGKALKVAFLARVQFRANDAIVIGMREQARYEAYQVNDNGEMIEPADSAPADNVEQIAYVEHLLSKIRDPRKCLAFRLHMDGCPISPGKGTTSIAEALGVSAKTAGEWITEVQSFLKKIGVSHEPA